MTSTQTGRQAFRFLLIMAAGTFWAAALCTSSATASNTSAGSPVGNVRVGDVAEIPPQAAAQVGSRAPDIELESIDGEALRLSELEGRTNVVLVFFRGTW